MTKAKQKSQIDIDWENRTLCIDENCIGVVGPDGLCKECGKPYEGFKPPTVMSEEPDMDTYQGDEVPATDEKDAPDDTEMNFDDSWDNRTLCVDESCIGVIGPDGRCKECGKSFKAEN